MGSTVLVDRLEAGGGGGSADAEGSTGGDGAGVPCGEDGGVENVISRSVGRVGGGGGNTEWS